MPARKAGAIRVEGVAELSRSLRAVGPEARSGLRDASKAVAGFVASDSAAAASSLGGVAAKSAPSLKPRGSVSGAAGVALGGSAYPFAGGAAFGSDRFKQFKPWKGNGPDAGYFLYPQIRSNAERIVAEYTTALGEIIKKAGLG